LERLTGRHFIGLIGGSDVFTTHWSQLRLTLAGLALAAGAAAMAGPVSASADSLGAFSCTDQAGGVAGARGTVTAIRAAHHDGYDRLVIGFATSNTMPAYRLTRQDSATFTRDASGQPVSLDGSAGLRVALQNSDIADGVPSDLKPQLPEVREVANIGNFERVVSYGIGLRDAACFRVLELSNPTRLVIDVVTAPDAPVAAAASSAAASQASPGAQASTAPIAGADPENLATTGQRASAPTTAAWPLAAVLIGLLAVVTGLGLVGIRQLARR
jgi:hypothetical protein